MNTIKITLLSIAVLMVFGGCDNFIETDIPDSQLPAVVVFEDKATANAAMTDIYSRIRDTGLLTGTPSGLSNSLGCYTDELDFYGSAGSSSLLFYNNSLLAVSAEIASMWNDSYSQIYATNAIIEGVERSITLPKEDKNQLRGEALFIRALLHFYLANLYGDIPYIKTTDYQINRNIVKMPINSVFATVKIDLNESIDLLSESSANTTRTRPNKSTGHALLARLNLYSGLWDEASEEASTVLNNPSYAFTTSINEEFLKESSATIWQLTPNIEGKNTEEAQTFIFTEGPPPAVALSSSLMKAFEQNDLRKSYWTKLVTDGSTRWYHANKYKEMSNNASSTEYSIILRIAEQYLIRAEARAHQGDLIGAKEDLNVIRKKAGLPDTAALSQIAIIDAVMAERRVELFTEMGHRFFDLKRTNTIDAVLATTKPGWETKDKLFPIPQMELLTNPNLLPQNTGF